jgi:hypothetical protein
MKKEDFKLKIEDPNQEWDIMGDLMVSAWDGDMMIDEHIAESFPELSELGLCDVTEGFMEYFGELDKSDLKAILEKRGFSAVVI